MKERIVISSHYAPYSWVLRKERLVENHELHLKMWGGRVVANYSGTSCIEKITF